MNDYIIRMRIEKSALSLTQTSGGITEIPIEYGFNDNSSYSRTFKKYFGVSPTEFRKQIQQDSPIAKQEWSRVS